ncbi:hypothetical protein JQK15_15630 [Sphingobium sp. BHU LFT2]|uniref:transporter substrate-binding domain-containing protein n=1 Tax=Sphingobium sp. BHU LFT2 TaxID=2807634 RepID=UPI001BE7DEC1|nr:transporter substrate-binding domain-containing protein [Sphingobium sp. BHU LFT2]MBT2244973.1 hypothetical protein [Sphingobium sp. BHU LFT2]
MKGVMVLPMLLLAACNVLPRDPAGTSTRVAKERAFTVALADPAVNGAPEVQRLVHEIERRTGAQVHWRPGTGEGLFAQLDDGTLDLVIGRFQADSPWAMNVAFGPPLLKTGTKEGPLELKAAMRNGENRWIMTVERASRAVSQEAREE